MRRPQAVGTLALGCASLKRSVPSARGARRGRAVSRDGRFDWVTGRPAIGSCRLRVTPFRRSLPLVWALGIDLTLGEPPAALHPVVWMGRLVAALERRAPRSAPARLVFGALGTGGVVGVCAFAGRLIERATDPLPLLPRLLVVSWLLKTTFALRSLFAAAESVRIPLRRDDLGSARKALRGLVSRDVTMLGPSLLAAAAVESAAENASDGAVAPILFYMAGGLPAALAYRAVNTLDSMWGYHGAYEHLGKAAARLDDLANLLPARLTGLALIGAALLSGRDAAGACYIMLRDHGETASPNAGWPMSAMAGALGVELEKVGHYCLGAPGASPTPATIRQSIQLVAVALGLFVGACILGEVVCDAATRH
jgi:adenosylcobinamide-phosphate synthase